MNFRQRLEHVTHSRNHRSCQDRIGKGRKGLDELIRGFPAVLANRADDLIDAGVRAFQVILYAFSGLLHVALCKT